MNSEGLNRREFLKKTVAAGVMALTPEVAHSAEKKQTPEEIFNDLRSRADNLQKKVADFKGLNPDLRKNIREKVLPEFKRRAVEGKDIAEAETALIALNEQGTEHLNDFGGIYSTFERLEKDIDVLMKE